MKKNVFPLLLLLLAGFFVYLALEKPEGLQSFDLASKKPSKPRVEELVNKNLFLTSKTMDLEAQKKAAENNNAPQIGESILPTVKPQISKGIDHSADTYETQALEDMRRDRKDLNYVSPDHVIQGQLYEQQQRAEYEANFKKEYARQFVENARRNGYLVQLSDDYVVLSVTPLRRPNSAPLEASPSEGRGSQ